ncbi:DUF2946 family protein [Pseudoxanthomonas suwonensis]|uniref:DUF2946 family protein n=1 Tax=Pseudoxanthomonas suwonensis TaxID=314722 RepID=UPI00138F0313|nr:DUF2946 family protein [Pseudoxanthomonas suwonensis]KAF1699307.1 hypothetical protein CSC68_14980 [Pseudoxanthomonas suwonensis]
MQRASRLHRNMARLALLAVLLLALAPAVGRALASGTPQLLAGWSELCTSEGLQRLPSEARSADGVPLPAAHGDADCPYCPLATSLLGPAAPPAALALSPVEAAPARRHAPGRRFRRLHGPGSRGPPILP